jgi:hypothetical protein
MFIDWGPSGDSKSYFYVGKLFGDDVIEAFFVFGDFPQMEPTPAMWEVRDEKTHNQKT